MIKLQHLREFKDRIPALTFFTAISSESGFVLRTMALLSSVKHGPHLSGLGYVEHPTCESPTHQLQSKALCAHVRQWKRRRDEHHMECSIKLCGIDNIPQNNEELFNSTDRWMGCTYIKALALFAKSPG